MSMIKDRLNKKWTALMLTEHVKEIRDWYESDLDILEPQYDEFTLNSLADDLNAAYQSKSIIRIIYWVNRRTEEYEGQIVSLLPNDSAIKIKLMDNGCSFKLSLQYIIKVYVDD